MSLKHFCNIVEMFYRSGSHNCCKTKIQQTVSFISCLYRNCVASRLYASTLYFLSISLVLEQCGNDDAVVLYARLWSR